MEIDLQEVSAASDRLEPREAPIVGARPRRPLRLAAASAAGMAIGAPFGWVLSYAGSLPFLLGVFFFALLGLIVGAIVFRVASPAAPYAMPAVLTCTTIVVLWTWGLAMFKESRDFPRDMAIIAADRSRDIGDVSAEEFREGIADGVRAYLRERYPPGGALGYARWALLSGEIPRGTLEGFRGSLRIQQAGVWWALRVVLSLSLLGFGIGSQTFQLAARGRDGESSV